MFNLKLCQAFEKLLTLIKCPQDLSSGLWSGDGHPNLSALASVLTFALDRTSWLTDWLTGWLVG